jgi:catechol 2,3-dioxygenase-like lactoylglutathione lyase family enzyme
MMAQQAGSPLGGDVAVTHILVVADPARSRDFWVDVLGTELYREYGGTSVVLRFAGTWLLLVSGCLARTTWASGVELSGKPCPFGRTGLLTAGGPGVTVRATARSGR